MNRVKYILYILCTILITGCHDEEHSDHKADLIVYGKIFTSQINEGKAYDDTSRYVMAEAMAVKDGKFVYVGNADGAAEYMSKIRKSSTTEAKA